MSNQCSSYFNQPLNSYLKKYFGYDQFRDSQNSIIQTTLDSNDLLAILPTGGGKSICYQLPGLIKPGLTLVISPLISLMSDQVSALQKKGISATFINSSISKKEKLLRLKLLKQEKYKFLYLAPERLLSQKIINILSQIKINQIAVDEAHCISLWGHDFRPSYLYIKNFINKLKNRPVISAFTATATVLVKQDIIKSLGLKRPKIFASQSLRTNLQLNVELTSSLGEKEVKLAKILSLNQGKTGIIYCSSIKNTHYLTSWLNRLNFNQKLCQTKIYNYHGKLNSDEKKLIQEKFMSGKIDLICATNAFGMGIDKDNIRFVIHYDIPGSLENYYQEVGRGGRDRKLSHAYLLFFQNDIKIQLGFIKKLENKQRQLIKLEKLKKMIDYCQNSRCLNLSLAKYFQLDYQPENYPSCSRCKQSCLCLNSTETEVFFQISKMKNISYFTCYLVAILQPKNKRQWKLIPGIGNNILNIYEKCQYKFD